MNRDQKTVFLIAIAALALFAVGGMVDINLALKRQIHQLQAQRDEYREIAVQLVKDSGNALPPAPGGTPGAATGTVALPK